MDITYVSNRKKFNYRVCAIIISNNKILAMHDERSPYLMAEFRWEKLPNTQLLEK